MSEPRMASVTALTEAKCMVLDRTTFNALRESMDNMLKAHMVPRAWPAPNSRQARPAVEAGQG
eukprot:2551321-Prymnesium_polylepis.1